MCGIVGYLGGKEAMPILLDGLKRLEYRGYDSAGMAVLGSNGLDIRRSVGKLKELEQQLQTAPLHGTMGIGHTRWATHGRPTEVNAHPHQVGHIAVVHNGIIENYLELKKQLIDEGHTFTSETDTEIIAQLIYKYSSQGAGFLTAVRQALRQVRGSYAIVVINSKEPRTLIGSRKESPLILGLGDGENFLASDVPAILSHTRRMVFLEDNDIVTMTDAGVDIQDLDGNPVNRPVTTITWSPAMAEKAGYKHFMLKEIFEQPRALIDTFRHRVNPDNGEIFLEEFHLTPAEVRNLKKVTMVACGTSFHAALVGKFLLEGMCRLPVDVDLGSEFRYRDPFVDPQTLFISISQSGETADTLAGLREAKSKGARTLAICNAVGSSIARESESVLYTHAGPEIGVASTKAFTTQLVSLYLIGLHLAKELGYRQPEQIQQDLQALFRLPTLLQEILDHDTAIREIGQKYMKAENFLYLGRSLHYPIALEGALKLKEISYIHAEGYPAGEMKHGPIALIDEHLPVVVLATRSPVFEKMMSNIEEVVARRGRVIAVSEADNYTVMEKVETTIAVPETTLELSPILLVLPLQLLAYHIADLRGTDVDQPRNLAKSVTVE